MCKKSKPMPVCIGFRPNEYRVHSVDNKGRGYIHYPGYATYNDAQAAVLKELAYPSVDGSWISQDIEPIYQ